MKNPFFQSRALVLFPLILVMVLDLVFTIAGQPKYYWQDYRFFNEGSPLGPLLLSRHPGYFIIAFLIYLLFVLFLAVNLRKPFNIILVVALFIAHSWGSASWVPELFFRFFSFYIDSWYLIMGYFFVIGIISGFCLNQWLKAKGLG